MRFFYTLGFLVPVLYCGYRIYESDGGQVITGIVSTRPVGGGPAAEAGNILRSFTPASAVARSVAYRGAIYYSPATNIESLDAAMIDRSRCNHLDIAMYALTDLKLAQMVVAFANSGRPVRIYRDLEQFEQEQQRSSWAMSVMRGNRNIRIRVKNSRVLMHLKAFSDGCFLAEGSANWSPAGEKEQDNTRTYTMDPAAVQAYEAEFASMWNRPDNVIIQ